MERVLKTQQLGVGDLFSLGWKLYNAHLADIVRVILCVYIPLNLIIPLLPADWQMLGDSTQTQQVSINIAQVLEFFIGIIATLAISALVEKAVHGETMTWHAALRHGLAQWLPAIGTGLFAGVIIFGLTLLFIIPGIIWSLYYAFWIYVVALRGHRGKAALDYSKRLVKGQWWRILGIFSVIGLTGLVTVLVVTGLLSLIAINPVADFIINTVASIVGALFMVVTIVFFLNTDYMAEKTGVSALGVIE